MLPLLACLSTSFDALPLFFFPALSLFSRGYSLSSTSWSCLSSLLPEGTCSPACLCSHGGCLTSKVTIRHLDWVGIDSLGFFPCCFLLRKLSLPWPTLNLSPQDFSVTNIYSTTSLCVGQSRHKNIGVFGSHRDSWHPKSSQEAKPRGWGGDGRIWTQLFGVLQ